MVAPKPRSSVYQSEKELISGVTESGSWRGLGRGTSHCGGNSSRRSPGSESVPNHCRVPVLGDHRAQDHETATLAVAPTRIATMVLVCHRIAAVYVLGS